MKGGTYTMREMLVPVFINGECVYHSPSVMEIAEYCRQEKILCGMRRSVSSTRTMCMWIFQIAYIRLRKSFWTR